MPKKPARSSRFIIQHPDLSLEKQPKAETPGAVLSGALNRASKDGQEPGVWDVIEWDDVIYRVHRLNGPEEKLDVRVEIIRA